MRGFVSRFMVRMPIGKTCGQKLPGFYMHPLTDFSSPHQTFPVVNISGEKCYRGEMLVSLRTTYWWPGMVLVRVSYRTTLFDILRQKRKCFVLMLP